MKIRCIDNLIQKYKNMSAPVKMAFWFLICSFLQKGIGMITTPVFTRVMTESEFGRFSVYNSWYSIISVFATLSITGNCFTRGLVVANSEQSKRELASSFYGLVITMIAFFGIIYVIFQDRINAATRLTSYQFLMMGIDFVTIQASYIWINSKRVKYEYKGIVYLTLVMAVIRPLIAIFLVLNAPETAQVEARLTGIAIANTAIFSWIIIYIFKNGKKFYDKNNWKYALTFCLPLIPHYLSQTILNQSDRIMISYFVGNSEAAYYTIAYTIAAIMSMFNNAVAQALDPWLYQSIKDKKLDRIGPISYRITAIIALLNFVVMAIAPEVLWILAPSNYSSALWAIPPVTASVFFIFMYDLFASFQFYFKKTKLIAIGSCGGAILNIILNAIFIPIFGYVAAGYTTLVCYILFGVLHYIFMRNVCKKYLDDYVVYDWKIIFGIGFLLIIASFAMLSLYEHIVIRYAVLGIIAVVMLAMRKKIAELFINIKKDH